MSAANPNVDIMNGYNRVRHAMRRARPDHIRDGIAWYAEVRAECHRLARVHDVPFRTVAGIIAVLSSTMPWERNKVAAEILLDSWTDGVRVAADMPAVARNHNAVEKVVAMLHGANPRDTIVKVAPTYRTQSWKTLVFWYNITGISTRRVTIDVHMWRLITGDWDSQHRPEGCEYMVCERILQKVARENDVRPNELQAILWLGITGKVA